MVNIKFSFNANDLNDVEIVKNAVDSIYSKIKEEQVDSNAPTGAIDKNSEGEALGSEVKEEVSQSPLEVSPNESQVEYYKVVDGDLSQTTNKATSLYQLKKNDAESFELRINESYLSPMEAILNQESYIVPFCDIIVDSDNSNFIEMDTPGKAIKVGSDVKIEEKMKVKLIKR